LHMLTVGVAQDQIMTGTHQPTADDAAHLPGAYEY